MKFKALALIAVSSFSIAACGDRGADTAPAGEPQTATAEQLAAAAEEAEEAYQARLATAQTAWLERHAFNVRCIDATGAETFNGRSQYGIQTRRNHDGIHVTALDGRQHEQYGGTCTSSRAETPTTPYPQDSRYRHNRY